MIVLRAQTSVLELDLMEALVKTTMWVWWGANPIPFFEISEARVFPAGPECPPDTVLHLNGDPATYHRYELFFFQVCRLHWANFANILPVQPNVLLIEHEGILDESQDSAPDLLSLTESGEERLLNSSTDS